MAAFSGSAEHRWRPPDANEEDDALFEARLIAAENGGVSVSTMKSASEPIERDNNGSSWMLFTLIGLVLGPVFIAIDGSLHNTGTRIVYTIWACAYWGMALSNPLMFIYRTFVRQLFEITPSFLDRLDERTPPWARVPWRLIRILDITLAWILAMSYAILIFWVWDESPGHDRFLAFCTHHGCSSIWGAWNLCLSQAVKIFVTNGSEVPVLHQGAVAMQWMFELISMLIFLLALTVGVTQVLESSLLALLAASARNQQQMAANQYTTPAPSGASMSTSAAAAAPPEYAAHMVGGEVTHQFYHQDQPRQWGELRRRDAAALRPMTYAYIPPPAQPPLYYDAGAAAVTIPAPFEPARAAPATSESAAEIAPDFAHINGGRVKLW